MQDVPQYCVETVGSATLAANVCVIRHANLFQNATISSASGTI